MTLVYVNGRFLSQPTSGMQRYALEMLNAIDSILDEGHDEFRSLRFVLLSPVHSNVCPSWKNIELVQSGPFSGHLWEQLTLYRLSRSHPLVSFGGVGPLLHRRHFLTLHDANVFVNPQFFSRAYRMAHMFLRPQLARKAEKLFTISRFSARELAHYCGVSEEAFTIVPNSADHLLRVEPDDSFVSRINLDDNEFFLCVGNLSGNKNISLVVEAFGRDVLKMNKLVVVGDRAESIFGNHTLIGHGDNVFFTGRISDRALVSLYKSCKAFIFPSFYEGFGIPPLEALTFNRPVLMSSIPSLREIYGSVGWFFSPFDVDSLVDVLNEFIAGESEPGEGPSLKVGFSQSFSWRRSAQLFLNELTGTLGHNDS